MRMAITWFEATDWPRWCAICPDLRPDYSGWLAKSEEAERQLQSIGVVVVRAHLDPDTFLAWAREHAGGDTGMQTRARYAALEAMQSGEVRH